MLALVGVCMVAATFPNRGYWRRVSPDFKPSFYEWDSKEADVKISLEEAVAKVEAVWPVPSTEETRFRLMRDDDENWTRWELEWRINGSTGLTALVDAYTGKVRVIVDFRRSGGVDNLKNRGKAIELAEEVLKSMEISTKDLSTPTVRKRDMPTALSWNITWDVQWRQRFKGLAVKDAVAAVGVSIDSETLKPVGFHNGLLEIHDVNIVPRVSRNQAIEEVKNFVSSEAVKSKGYDKCKILRTELVVARPNYNLKQNKRLIPRGPPTLVWHMHLRNAISGRKLADIMVDAQTGTVVGFMGYR